MPELRRDVTTGQWVIVANKRARRPHDMAAVPLQPGLTAGSDEDCPFCPGHEDQTPPPTYVVPLDDSVGGDAARRPGVVESSHPTTDANTRQRSAGEPPWLLRVVPNRFPALVVGEQFEPPSEPGFFERASASGLHEVVIETPVHDADLWQLPLAQVERVVAAYAARERALRARSGVTFAMTFRNHGRDAGASLEHPHSQIMATSAVPPAAALRFETARNHFDRHGKPLYQDLLEREISEGERVIETNDHFTVLAPFASRLPFETWILPHAQSATLSGASETTLSALAAVLQRTLARIDQSLGDPAYNMIVYSAPVGDENGSYFTWHLQIVPRVTIPAGFELGSGVFINIVRPEEAAVFLTAADPSAQDPTST